MTITLIKLGDTHRQAFLRGLWKGAAAPLMLFAANRAVVEPIELEPLPPVKPVRLPSTLTQMTDLQRIGMDFSTAVRRYEQADPQQPTLGGQAR